jgi:hypothetical protein
MPRIPAKSTPTVASIAKATRMVRIVVMGGD